MDVFHICGSVIIPRLRDPPVPGSCFCFITILNLAFVPLFSLSLSFALSRPPQCSGSLCSGCTSTLTLSLLNNHAPFVSVGLFPCTLGFLESLGRFEDIPCQLLHFLIIFSLFFIFFFIFCSALPVFFPFPFSPTHCGLGSWPADPIHYAF